MYSALVVAIVGAHAHITALTADVFSNTDAIVAISTGIGGLGLGAAVATLGTSLSGRRRAAERERARAEAKANELRPGLQSNPGTAARLYRMAVQDLFRMLREADPATMPSLAAELALGSAPQILDSYMQLVGLVAKRIGEFQDAQLSTGRSTGSTGGVPGGDVWLMNLPEFKAFLAAAKDIVDRSDDDSEHHRE